MKHYLVLGFILSVAGPSNAFSLQVPENHRDFSFRGMLREVTWMASKLDCYFTIEEFSGPSRRDYNEISGKVIQVRTDVRTIDDLVQALRDAHKNAVVFRNPKNTAVIHIIHKTLHGNEKHFLNQKINISHDGSPTGLIEAIGKQSGRLSLPKLYSFSGRGIDADGKTKIRVRAHGQTVRSILTDFVPLSEFRRVLWVSETENSLKTTEVRFKGGYPYEPLFHAEEFPDHPERTRDNPNPFLDFGNGQGAYYGNAINEKTQRAAVEWIVDEMKKKEPRQVRWAMFFLGKHKCQEAALLLLKHLDYRFTECGVIEESYPAVKGLTGMGKSITPVLAAALEKETNETRLRLLAKTLFNLHGPQESAKIINEIIKGSIDEPTRQRLEKTVQVLREFSP